MTAAGEARRRFADDQTAAALAEARRVALRVIAGQSPVAWQRPSCAYDALMARRLNEGFAAGQITLCPHPDPQLFWLVTPGSPAGCRPCVAAWAVAHLGGTDADTACDICGQVAVEWEQRHLIGTCPARPGPAALTVIYSVCAACAAAEEDEQP
jgi:hypothetical protein